MAVPGTSKVGTGTAKTPHSFLTSLNHDGYMILVQHAGFEPANHGLEGRCSIQLS